MQYIITNTNHEKLIFTSLEGIRWKISKGLREEWWIELMREGEFSLGIPEYIVQNFRFVFAWFGSNILILVTNLSTYFNPATTFLLFSQSFVDLTTYTNSLVFVPLPCEISVSFFTPFSTKFPFDFFIVVGLQDCARQKVSGLYLFLLLQ